MAAVDAHIAAQARLRAGVVTALARIWSGLGSYNRSDLDIWLTRALPLVEAAQRQSVAITDAYLAAALGRGAMGLDAERVIGAAARSGTPPEEVYSRPFRQMWHDLGAGKQWADAAAGALALAQSSAEMDVQLAMRGAASEIGEADDGIYGFERVPDGNACELCLIASTQRYHTGDLMPIHNRCGCSVAPLTSPTDRVINRDLYRELKSDGAMDRITQQRINAREKAAGREPGSTTVQVREHGELGPVLTNSEHDFALL